MQALRQKSGDTAPRIRRGKWSSSRARVPRGEKSRQIDDCSGLIGKACQNYPTNWECCLRAIQEKHVPCRPPLFNYGGGSVETGVHKLFRFFTQGLSSLHPPRNEIHEKGKCRGAVLASP